MTFSPMFPFVLSVCIIIVGSIPSLFLPETLQTAKSKRSNSETPEQDSGNEQPQPPSKKTVLGELTRQARELGQSTRFIWTDSNICLMVLVLFVTVMSRQCTNLLLQYVSKKFDWSISRVCIHFQSNKQKLTML
jgi:hypothetical protein